MGPHTTACPGISYLPGYSCHSHFNCNSLPGPNCLPHATPIYVACAAMRCWRKVVLETCGGVQRFEFSCQPSPTTYDVPRPLRMHALGSKFPADQWEGQRRANARRLRGRIEGALPGSKSGSSALDLRTALPQQAQLQQQQEVSQQLQQQQQSVIRQQQQLQQQHSFMCSSCSLKSNSHITVAAALRADQEQQKQLQQHIGCALHPRRKQQEQWRVALGRLHAYFCPSPPLSASDSASHQTTHKLYSLFHNWLAVATYPSPAQAWHRSCSCHRHRPCHRLDQISK